MELAPYDYARAPLGLVRGKKVYVPVDYLRADVNCAICLNIMDNSAMTLECSHRFCKECIEKSIRLASNDCPTCRGKINTRRSLREDHRLDFLIRAIFGSVPEMEKREEELRKLIVRPNSSKLEIITTTSTSVDRQSRSSSSSPSVEEPAPKRQKTSPGQLFVGTADDIMFVLRKHPHSKRPPATKKEYIKAPSRLTVAHMEMFLLQQFNQHHGNIAAKDLRYEILYYDAEGAWYLLDPSNSVDDLLRKFKRSNRAADLVLHYCVKGEVTG